MYQIWFILTAYVIRQPNIATAELRTQIQLASTAHILKYTLFVLSAKVMRQWKDVTMISLWGTILEQHEDILS